MRSSAAIGLGYCSGDQLPGKPSLEIRTVNQ
jgi:hypothetical protein